MDDFIRILSTIHAVISTSLSVIILAREKSLWQDPIFGECALAKYTLAFSSAYMICDLISMNLYWSGTELYLYWMHHGVSALAFILSMNQHALMFFALYRLCSECSTPFVNMRWFFLTLGVDKGSRRVLIQTFLFALFFVLSRILTIPVYWYMFYISAGTPDFYLLLANFKSVSFVWVLSSVVLDALNVYWLFKIIPKGLTTGVRLFAMLKRHHVE